MILSSAKIGSSSHQKLFSPSICKQVSNSCQSLGSRKSSSPSKVLQACTCKNNISSIHRSAISLRCQASIQEAQQSKTLDPPVKTKVLFVCLGNICRSPTAEAVFTALVEKDGLSDQIEIDSCGTGGGSPDWYREGGWSYHVGDPSDSRMREVAQSRGVMLMSRSRPLTPKDLANFDYIIGMDQDNLTAIHEAASYWASKHEIPADYRSKVKLMCKYLQGKRFAKFTEVPDPYYGGRSGFETVLDLLEDACQGLLDNIVQGIK